MSLKTKSPCKAKKIKKSLFTDDSEDSFSTIPDASYSKETNSTSSDAATPAKTDKTEEPKTDTTEEPKADTTENAQLFESAEPTKTNLVHKNHSVGEMLRTLGPRRSIRTYGDSSAKKGRAFDRTQFISQVRSESVKRKYEGEESETPKRFRSVMFSYIKEKFGSAAAISRQPEEAQALVPYEGGRGEGENKWCSVM